MTWPAYNSAAIVSLSQRTAAADLAHTESQRILAETRATLRWAATRLSRPR